MVMAKIERPITDPPTQNVITGFLPYLSLSAPINGAKANCDSA